MTQRGLFCVGVLLIVAAVAYQYRTDISLFLQRYTASPCPRHKERTVSTLREQPTPTPEEKTQPPSSQSKSDKEFYNPPFDPDNPVELRSKSGTRLITQNELAAHGPNGPLQPIMLAILGRVYDVDVGRDYYGPDGGYNFFAGIDGSRAYVTGEFDDKGLTDDLKGFSPIQVGEIDGWVKFYDETYTFVGKLIGRYYNQDGNPTKEWYKVQELLSQKEKVEEERKALQKRFPGCNSRWTKTEGGYVFCSEKSGGVYREWVGFPRRYFSPGSTDWRCACVHEDDLNNPHIKPYPDCDGTAVTCKVDAEKLKNLKS